MKLYLFVTTQKFERVPPETIKINCNDPRILRILKRRNIVGVPCLWVKSQNIDSIYYDDVIQEYFDSLAAQEEVIPDPPFQSKTFAVVTPPLPELPLPEFEVDPIVELPKVLEKPAIPFGPDFNDR